MGVEYHVALVVANFCVGVGCCVVKEVGYLVECFLGGVDLRTGYGAEGDKHGEVKGDGVVKEGANNLLYKLLLVPW